MQIKIRLVIFLVSLAAFRAIIFSNDPALKDNYSQFSNYIPGLEALIKMNGYEVGELLGNGMYSFVYEANSLSAQKNAKKKAIKLSFQDTNFNYGNLKTRFVMVYAIKCI